MLQIRVLIYYVHIDAIGKTRSLGPIFPILQPYLPFLVYVDRGHTRHPRKFHTKMYLSVTYMHMSYFVTDFYLFYFILFVFFKLVAIYVLDFPYFFSSDFCPEDSNFTQRCILTLFKCTSYIL